MAYLQVLGSPIYHKANGLYTACGIEPGVPFPSLRAVHPPDSGLICRTCEPPVEASPMQTLEAPALIETSMSALDTFTRCPKKYEFQEVRGWLPRSASKPMVMGTAFHAAIAAGNRAVRDYDARKEKFGEPRNDMDRAWLFKDAATIAIKEIQVDRDGKQLGLTDDDRVLLTDMIEYWFEQAGERDLLNIAEILLVEEPLYIQIGRYLIRCTVDAAYQYFDQPSPIIVDYKTGDPTSVKAWIGLDIQTSAYYVAARGRFGKVVQFSHRFVDRAVPPGVGHNPLTTASGKDRPKKTLESMQDPKRYIGQMDTALSDATVDAHTRELIDIVQGIEDSKLTNRWIRNRVKIGPMSCDKCPYFEPCKAERDGNPPMDESLAALSYIIRGSDEWQKLLDGKLALEAKD